MENLHFFQICSNLYIFVETPKNL